MYIHICDTQNHQIFSKNSFSFSSYSDKQLQQQEINVSAIFCYCKNLVKIKKKILFDISIICNNEKYIFVEWNLEGMKLRRRRRGGRGRLYSQQTTENLQHLTQRAKKERVKKKTSASD